MPRKSNGPRYYASKKTWFANLDGERIPLVTGPKSATEQQAKELYNAEKQAREGLTQGDYAPVWTILNAYVNWLTTRKNPSPISQHTAYGVLSAVNTFCDMFGQLTVRELGNHHIDQWLSQNQWSHSTCGVYLKVIRAGFVWASTTGGLITRSPFRSYPRWQRESLSVKNGRRLAITEAEHKALCGSCQERGLSSFANFLKYLWFTGARTSEVRLLRSDEWDPKISAYVIKASPENHGRFKLARYGHDRLIYIPNHLAKLNDQLLDQADRTGGYLFVTRLGGPYSLQGINKNISRLVAELPTVRDNVIAYSYRHSFVTRWLVAGGDPYHLAELIGTSLEMIRKHYSHLFENHDVLRSSLNRFVS